MKQNESREQNLSTNENEEQIFASSSQSSEVLSSEFKRKKRKVFEIYGENILEGLTKEQAKWAIETQLEEQLDQEFFNWWQGQQQAQIEQLPE